MHLRLFSLLSKLMVGCCALGLVAHQGKAVTALSTLALDPAFAPVIEITDGWVYSVIAQPDGKLIVGGRFARINGVSRNHLARLTRDGAVDPTFTPGMGPNGDVSATALQPDGRVIVVGYFSAFGTADRTGILRLNADGSLDTSFVPTLPTRLQQAGGLTSGVVAVQSDGHILVGATVGLGAPSLFRLARDGSLDPAFVAQGGPDSAVRAIRVLASGKILVAGSFSLYNGTPHARIVRLNADGTVDPDFKSPPFTDFSPVAMDVCPDGTIMLGAARSSANLVHLLADGSVDEKFGKWGGTDRNVTSIAAQPDGRIVVAGSFGKIAGVEQQVLRLMPDDGSVDPDWQSPVMSAYPQTILLLKDNRILVGGQSSRVDGLARSGLARLHADGSHDLTFGAQVRSAGMVFAMARRPDRKILIGGYFDYVNGKACERLALLNADGTTADGFSASLELVNIPLYSAQAEALALQPDGRLLVGGKFNKVNGVARNSLTRLQADGSIDPTFLTGTGPNGDVTAIAVQSDRRILLGGYFSEFAGANRRGLTRLTETGALDPSFDPRYGTSNYGMSAIAVDAAGRILIGGPFGNYNGAFGSGIAGVLPDGAVDASFSAPFDNFSWTFAIAQTTNGSIYAAGLIDLNIWAEGVMDLKVDPRHLALVRLKSNGKVDGSFTPVPASRFGGFGVLALQSDGSIIAGRAYNISGVTTNSTGLVRFLSSGSLDSNFRVLGLENPEFSSLTLLEDGTMLAGGARFHDEITDQRGLAKLASPRIPSLTSPTTAVFIAGRECFFTLAANGCPAPTFELVSGKLPSWAVWHPGSATISGTAVLEAGPEAVLAFRAVNVLGQSSPQEVRLQVLVPPTFTQQPHGMAVAVGGSLTLTVAAKGTPAPSYQWRKNGIALPGETSSSITLSDMQPARAAAYTVMLTNSAGVIESDPAVVGVRTEAKVIGSAIELDEDIKHPSGRIYDQVLLRGQAATVTADRGQVTRLSYIDSTDDIVQVEFAGAGSLTITLESATEPAAPLKYNQNVSYAKGHASLVVVGADETTNLGVFSVGRITAVNQALFRDDVTYDGFADLRSIAIASVNGKFGGLRTANAVYSAAQGTVGIQAVGTDFTGPVYLGDLQGSGTAEVVMFIGSADTIAVTGGDLLQSNGQAIRTFGIDQLQFWAGVSSQGVSLPAQHNQARLLQDGIDITDLVVVPPAH